MKRVVTRRNKNQRRDTFGTKRSTFLRGASLCVGLLMLGAIMVSSNVHDTAATWNDSEMVGATLSAAQIPVAANVRCASSDTPLGGPVASISWSSASVINGSSVGYKLVGKQQLSDPEWLKIIAPTTSPFEFKTGLLGGILNTVLMLLLGNGSEFHVGVVVVHSFGGVEWESAVAPAGKVVKAQGGALNLISGFKCQP